MLVSWAIVSILAQLRRNPQFDMFCWAYFFSQQLLTDSWPRIGGTKGGGWLEKSGRVRNMSHAILLCNSENSDKLKEDERISWCLDSSLPLQGVGFLIPGPRTRISMSR